MKYAVRYYRNSRALEYADEIIIKYFEKNTNLVNYVQEWDAEKAIILNIIELESPEQCIEIFKAATAAHKNLRLLCSKDQPIQVFAENNLPFFFIEGAGTLDELFAQYRLGVSDIYITNELGFYLKEIAEYFKQFVKIRVIPNIAQSSSDIYIEDFKKFFIRPEDLELYEDYIDVVEFAGPLTTQPTYCEIYKNGRWQGELEDIIINFNAHIHSMNIVPNFGVARINCKKRCGLRKCNICDNIQSAAEVLKEKNLYIAKRKRVYEDIDTANSTPIEQIDPVS